MNLKSRPSIAPSLPTLPSAKENVEDATGSNEIRKGKDENDAGETTNEENVLKEEDDEERQKGKCLNHLTIDEQNKLTVLTFGRLIDKRTSLERDEWIPSWIHDSLASLMFDLVA